MKPQTVARANFFEYPRQVPVSLIQTGPKTFVWAAGSFRMTNVPSFRSKDAAIAFAIENGWRLS